MCTTPLTYGVESTRDAGTACVFACAGAAACGTARRRTVRTSRNAVSPCRARTIGRATQPWPRRAGRRHLAPRAERCPACCSPLEP
eukprot:4324977-Prymnesium_polylepis.1